MRPGALLTPAEHGAEAFSHIGQHLYGKVFMDGLTVMCMAMDSSTLSYFGKSPPLLTAQLPCRDLYNDIAMPGGISNKSFVREWDGFCAAMDSNDFTKLPGHSALPLMLVSKYAGPPQSSPHSLHPFLAMMRCCHTAQHTGCQANES